MINHADILGARILVVDDQHANVLLLTRMLDEAGYRNITATMNPLEVCALHRKNDFDLILLDLQMPGMDGFQVMEGLKTNEADDYLPVIVLTAQPGHKLRALQAGAKDFISKPFDLVEVKTRIHNMIEVRLLYRQLEQFNAALEETVKDRTAELRESEARYRSLTELASDWYWEQDADLRFVTGASGEMLRAQNRARDRESPIGKLRWELNDTSRDPEHWQDHQRTLLAHQPFRDFSFDQIDEHGALRALNRLPLIGRLARWRPTFTAYTPPTPF